MTTKSSVVLNWILSQQSWNPPPTAEMNRLSTRSWQCIGVKFLISTVVF